MDYATLFLSLAGLIAGALWEDPTKPSIEWGLIFSIVFGTPVLAGLVLAGLAMVFRSPTEEEKTAQWKANRFEAAVIEASTA